MQNIKRIILLCLMVGSWYCSFAQSGFQPNQVNVTPLYLISAHGYTEPVAPLNSNISLSAGATSRPSRPAVNRISVVPRTNAWKGNLSAIGAVAPVEASAVTMTPTIHRVQGNTHPVDPAPPWRYALLVFSCTFGCLLLLSLQTAHSLTCITETLIEEMVNNNHDYVDLGLSSDALWTTCNVEALMPEDAGGFYAWDERLSSKQHTHPI